MANTFGLLCGHLIQFKNNSGLQKLHQQYMDFFGGLSHTMG
jgi:hypothetical protein